MGSCELALLENCHNITYIIVILISNNLFSIFLITPVIHLFLPKLIRDSRNIRCVGILKVQVVHALLLVPLAILAAQYIVFLYV